MSADVLVVGEHRRGELRESSLSAIEAGRELAEATGGSLRVAVAGAGASDFAEACNRRGVETVYLLEYPEEFNHDRHVEAIAGLFDELDGPIVLLPHTADGYDYAPAVADAIDRPLVTDVTGMRPENGTVAVTRDLYGGKTRGRFAVPSDGFAATVRGGAWPAAGGTGEAAFEVVEVGGDGSVGHYRELGFGEPDGAEIDISDAEVIVGVGRGIDDEENLELIEDLCEAMGATLAASRPLIDAGWLPKSRQVGQSGTTVTPDLYVAIGISGAVEHVAGMKGSKRIVAINDDPSAPIFDIADYGIVGDLFDVVPALIESFES